MVHSQCTHKICITLRHRHLTKNNLILQHHKQDVARRQLLPKNQRKIITCVVKETFFQQNH